MPGLVEKKIEGDRTAQGDGEERDGPVSVDVYGVYRPAKPQEKGKFGYCRTFTWVLDPPPWLLSSVLYTFVPIYIRYRCSIFF